MKKKKRSKKKDFSGLIFLLIFCAIFIGGIFLALQKPTPVFKDPLTFPVGEDLLLCDVVTDVKNGTLLDSRRVLDSSEEGSFEIRFVMENLFQRKSEDSVLIQFYSNDSSPVKDTEKINPQSSAVKITAPEKIFVYIGEAPDFSLCSAENEKGEKISLEISENYDVKKEGEYKLTLTAKGENSAIAKKEIFLYVLSAPFGKEGSLNDGTYQTKNGKTLKIEKGIATVDGILIANKSYSLPKTYPASSLTKEVQDAFDLMKQAAKDAGHTLTVKSGYRSYERQEYLFNNYVKNDGLEDALTYSARPGHSEHQTGLGMDINTASTAESKQPSVKVTLDWLNENAYKFGFVLRYPDGKSDITGYIFEPWHYRYVGCDLAEKLYNNGDWITLEEYFGIDSIYRGY